MLKIALKCNVCSDIVYLRSDDDQRYCSCGNVLAMKHAALFENSDKFELTEIDIPHTEQELYDDWNLIIDKLGIILGHDEINSGSEEGNPVRRSVGRGCEVGVEN